MITTIDTNIWTEYPTYWLNKSPQCSPLWHKLKNARITASNFATACNLSKFKTPEELADEMAGLKKKEFSPESLAVMEFGTKTEPEARQWYESQTGQTVSEVGLALWKSDIRIGASPDGLVGHDGIIEIKCPKIMYKPILAYQQYQKSNCNSYRHIWPSHYYQMQGTMAVFGRKYADYIVYCPTQDQVFCQRIPFNETLWKNELYPKLVHFLDNILGPRLELAKGQGLNTYQRLDPS